MAREKYGNTWWGEQWLQALQKIDYSNRIPRGLSYARRGMVSDITLKKGSLYATVKGSRPRPYQVTLSMGTFKKNRVKAMLDDVMVYPTIISRLLNGKMDQQLLQLAKNHQLDIFPKEAADMEMKCSCPDWAVPCKHIAAAIYKICADIDNNPFVLFEFRGIDLIKLLKQRDINVLDVENRAVDSYEGYVKSLAAKAKRVYDYSLPDYTQLNNRIEEHIALLEDSPSFYLFGDFKTNYSQHLLKIAKTAEKVLQEKVDINTIMSYEEVQKIDMQQKLICSVKDKKLHLENATISTLWNIDHTQLNLCHPSIKSKYFLLRLAFYCIARGLIIPKILIDGTSHFIIWKPSTLDHNLSSILEELQGIDQIKIDTAKVGVEAVLTLLISALVPALYRSIVKKPDDYLELFFNERSLDFDGLSESSIGSSISRWLKLYYFDLGDFFPVIYIDELDKNKFSVDIQIAKKKGKLSAPISFSKFVKKSKSPEKLFDFYKDLDLLSTYMPEMGSYIDGRGKESMIFSDETFPRFIFEIQPILQLLGIKVVMPKSLKHLIRPKLSVSVSSSSSESSGLLSLAKLLNFDWRISLGKDLVTEADFNKVVKKAKTLIKYKGEYIYIDEGDLIKLRKELTKDSKLSNIEILQIALAEEYKGTPINISEEVKALIDQLTKTDLIESPKELQATFRPYQLRGYSWMYKNTKIGLGSIIADDMGLGKTLQVIALICKLQEEGLLKKKQVMIIVPTSLIPNWESEFQKFAPSIEVYTHYGPKREFEEYQNEPVLLTSYGVLRSDIKILSKCKWLMTVIDEAQNIKNPTSQQTKAIKSIPRDFAIAMSGTPVENKLLDYWSVMDFTNKGLLGNKSKFTKEYAKPISKDGDMNVLNRFTKITAPFIMRRMKTDKSIISDLPDKIVQDTFSSLTVEQSALYQEVLTESITLIQSSEGSDSKSLFKRQGLVLQMILALKQICNHPAQWLKEDRHAAEDSGKLSLLIDLIKAILEANEKVLIFTQFKGMGDILKACIADHFDLDALWLHGGVSLTKRKKMVDAFQNMPHQKIMILSLKAGGTGLNLTAANHVIHYDLWWNPAVEAQATDRAYRIGQNKNVFVHRLITKHTFEEKINDLINSKKKLANMAVKTGEKWIGQMNDQELLEVFELGE